MSETAGIVVLSDTVETTIGPGETVSFGRHPGPGQIESTAEPGLNVTQPAYRNVRWTDGRGRVYRWYQVLVARCEPRLSTPPEDYIPSNAQIAKRLGFAQHQGHRGAARPRIRDELGFERFSEPVRLAAVTIAINQGLVTPADLAVLLLEGDTDE